MSITLALIIGVCAAAAWYVLFRRELRYWLPYCIIRELSPKERGDKMSPVHLCLCVADHFEPGHGNAGADTQEARVKAWTEGYPAMADRHRDADGEAPQHTWFYPPHHDHRFLAGLAGLSKRGYGEIEMHLHHNRMEPFPDTALTLRGKIENCLRDYSKHGIFCVPGSGAKRFAFVHGDWSLDNSRGAEFCGVNNEIDILREFGCYADFTFPSLGRAQPAMVNRIYYAIDDPERPKSYNTGVEVASGRKPAPGLMIVNGIIGLRLSSRANICRPSIEVSNLGAGDEPSPGRIDYWARHAISIRGAARWKFIKLHTHGAPEHAWGALFGNEADAMFSYLENVYNDGKRYVLHYVTARQMYNIIKAAEAGKGGNPNDYRNYEIPAYAYV